MIHAKPVPSQIYREHIVALIEKEQSKTVVEVGVYSGKLSKMLAAVSCITSLTIIDHWEEWPNKFSKQHMEDLFQQVSAWAKPIEKVLLLRMYSVEASRMFGPETIDFWETDGDHRYASLLREIEAWYPAVKTGGIMCGDNYEAESVFKAVDERFPNCNTEAKGRIWWIRK